MKGALLLTLLLVCPLVQAAMWDRDRPANDDLPSHADIITGRFDRLPDVYYEGRLERVLGRIDELPRLGDDPDPALFKPALPLFNDAAVALTRLGRYDKAVSLMDRKLLILDVIGEHDFTLSFRHRVEALANKAAALLRRGREGDRREAVALLEQAAERDRYGLDAKWALAEAKWRIEARYTPRDGEIFPNFLGVSGVDFRGERGEERLQRRGLAGVIGYLGRRVVHGGAWDDVDVMYAYSLALALAGNERESALAWLRITELIEQGGNSALPEAPSPAGVATRMGVHLPDDFSDALVDTYATLRANANAWVSSRNDYASRLIEQGRHPDTDTAFWAGWRLDDQGPPRADDPPPEEEPTSDRTLILGGVAALIVLFVTLLLAAMLLGRGKSPHPTVDEL